MEHEAGIKTVKETPRKPLILILGLTGTVFLIGTLLFVARFSPPATPTGPWGEILVPTSRSVTGHHVIVSAKIANLELGQYVWLTVDKPDLGLCWPKAPKIEPNTLFSTTIYEGDPKEAYTLLLYAIPKTLHDQWTVWANQNRLGGLPMPPDNRRLDSIQLISKTPAINSFVFKNLIYGLMCCEKLTIEDRK